MRETEYRIYKNKNNEVEITALVPSYSFNPDGTAEDWITYAKDQAKTHNWNKVKLFRESEDKQTGYSSYHFVCDITT